MATYGSPVTELPPGWVRVDCHLHTVASGDAVLGLEELAERAVAEGVDVVFVTDHHEVSAALELRDGDYFGRAVNRAARLRSLATGGQILCSGAIAELVAADRSSGAGASSSNCFPRGRPRSPVVRAQC